MFDVVVQCDVHHLARIGVCLLLWSRTPTFEIKKAVICADASVA